MRQARFSFIEWFILIMVVFFGLDTAWDYYQSIDEAEKTAQAVFTATTKELSKDLDQIIKAADTALLTVSAAYKMQLINFLDTDRLNTLFMPRMKIYPFISSVNLGDSDGNGYLILKTGNEWKNRIKKASEKDSVLWVDFDENGKVISKQHKKDDYDPRKRPWYQNALKQEGIVWSEPYMFRTTRDVGITASLDLSSKKNGEIVIGLDIMLKDLSTALAGFLSAYNGFTAHLVTDSGQIIACSDTELFLSCMSKEGAPLPDFRDCGYPQLEAAMQAKGENGAIFRFAFEGVKFVSTQQRIRFSPKTEFTLFLTAPESALRGGFWESTFLRMLVFVVLLSVASIWYVSRYLAPLRKLAYSMKKMGKGKFSEAGFDLSRNDEIGDLVSEFKNMSEAIAAQQKAIKASEQQYRSISQEFNAVLDAIPDNITLQTSDLKVIWANKGAAGNLGLKPDDLTGRHCYTVWHKRGEPCESCPVLRSFSTGRADHETVITPDGKIWELRTIPILDEQGNVRSVLEVGRDVTEHRRLEAQLRQAQKMEAVGQLTGGVAHDFNNILSAIIGYGHILKVKLGSGNGQDEINEILKSADRAARLTHSLLAFSRKQIMLMNPLNLNVLIMEMKQLLLSLIGEQITLNTELLDKKLMINADAGQIEQVLMNLVVNAKDAMPEGGTMKIQTGFADLDDEFMRMHEYGNPGRYAVMTVSDTGAGMDEETRKKIFEPFFTTKEVGKGSGLGLAMTYGIIKQHDGVISCYSEPGKGTIFSIYLPLLEDEKEEARSEPVTRAKEMPRGTETILIAEDDPTLRKLARTVLTEFGYTTIEARDGQEAVKLFSENRDSVRLLLFDVMMPKMKGLEAVEEIRKIKSDIKAIFMSGYTADDIERRGLSEKNTAFLYKPVSPSELLHKVREILDSERPVSSD